MKTTSINHPWAISDKIRYRYGDVWANLDFVFQDKISENVFKSDPMNTTIGQLYIYNQQLDMIYKDLINYAKSVRIMTNEAYVNGEKNASYDVRLKSQTFTLTRHELSKLADTLEEASTTAMRAYELGLYL